MFCDWLDLTKSSAGILIFPADRIRRDMFAVYVKNFAILILLNLYACDASLLLLSNKPVRIPALKRFEQEDFDKLLRKHDSPKIICFKGNVQAETVDLLRKSVAGNMTYVINEQIALENATTLSGYPKEDTVTIQSIVQSQLEDGLGNIFIIFVDEKDRIKREVTDTPENPASVSPNISGPVVYIPDTEEAIIYSSKPMALKLPNSTIRLLGEAKLVTANTIRKSSYKIIRVGFIEGKDKLFLNFIFPYSDSYWSMVRVEVEPPGGSKYNLTTKKEITAPRRFSYHCSGETVFLDQTNNVQLNMTDLQVQLNTSTSRFNDAYDCVPFTTGPIWSGLFVTSILAIGLIIALTAIGSIKTMDKFDNHKTKQLSITVFE